MCSQVQDGGGGGLMRQKLSAPPIMRRNMLVISDTLLCTNTREKSHLNSLESIRLLLLTSESLTNCRRSHREKRYNQNISPEVLCQAWHCITWQKQQNRVCVRHLLHPGASSFGPQLSSLMVSPLLPTLIIIEPVNSLNSCACSSS